MAVRTDKPEAELGLFQDSEQLCAVSWLAHRELSSTIHHKMKDLLRSVDKDWQDLGGIVCFRGPGSFTGLRIGISTANALASALRIPIVGASGDGWIRDGLQKLHSGAGKKMIVPEYGALPNITRARK